MTTSVETPARRTTRVLGTSACVAVATIASTSSLGAVVGPGTWVATTVRAVLVLAVVTGLVRLALERSHAARDEVLAPPAALLPTLAGAIAAAWALLGLYGGPTDRFSLLIGLSNVDRLVSRLQTARELTVAEVAPIDPSLPIELLVVGGALVVFLVADLVAGGLRLGAVAALPLLALWVPGLVIAGEISPVAFVATVAALVVLLALDNPHRAVRRLSATGGRGRRGTTGGLRAAGVVAGALVVALAGLGVGSASADLPGLASSSWSRLFSSTGQTVRLSDDLDMRRNLDERSGQVVLRYAVDGEADPGPLRMFTLTGFDGTNWRRGADREGEPVESPDEILWPEEIEPGEPLDLQVTLASLRDTKLPLPTEPRTLDATDEWAYDAVRDEVLGETSTRDGMSYSMRTYPRALSADMLRAAGGADPDDPNYLDVPDSAHGQDIRDLTTEVVGSAETRYDQALALQEYFRDTSRFTYSTEVAPGETGDAVWDFLQDRTGYCVQFATSMTMMARTLGIPARLGVGFLPGTAVGDSSFAVTGRDSHAWPELYFPGEGWVRFEPTPAQQTGAAPSWAIPTADSPGPQTEAPDEVPTSTATPSSSASDGPSAPSGDVGGMPAGAQDESTWVLVASTVVLVLALIGLGLWLVSRRRASAHRYRDAEDAWTVLLERLAGLGVVVPPSTTPRAMPRVVAERVAELSDGRLDDRTVEALVGLSSALESERYERRVSTSDPTLLRELVETAASGTADVLSDHPARDAVPTAPRGG
ncbi:transglutaminase domain-containing protein [Cellulosimicrobium terreum]|nr:transglutaminase domain-containing protein [Cellulosimicrobium terreum]